MICCINNLFWKQPTDDKNVDYDSDATELYDFYSDAAESYDYDSDTTVFYDHYNDEY